MKRIVLVALCLVLGSSIAVGKNNPSQKKPADFRPRLELKGNTVSDNEMFPVKAVEAINDTAYLAYYTFDNFPSCDTEGWTSVDRTAQLGDYFHVDDFSGLGGGWTALEGTKSLWCGARPTTADPLCAYATLPGYGNFWDQAFCSPCVSTIDTVVTVDYYVKYDSEAGYDGTTLDWVTCTGGEPTTYYQSENSINGGSGEYWGSGGPTFESINIDLTGQFMLRFHFTSDGAWSDEDGLYATNGAIFIDSLTVSDGTGIIIATEDFEDESVGDIDATDWQSCTPPGYGDLSQLIRAVPTTYQNDPVEEDPCASDFSCMWNFVKGSTYNYACNSPNPSPQQAVVPFVNSRDQYIHNEIWSPWIPISGTGSIFNLEWDVYRDLPLDYIVFYIWHVRTKDEIGGTCPQPWQDRDFVYYGGAKDWLRVRQPFGDLLLPGATHVQVALGVIDMCPFWCGVVILDGCHSHAPMFDNVEVYRVAVSGPQISARDMDMFQDTFSTDGTVTGEARADMAQDIHPRANPVILPGDSVVISVNDPEVGLGADSYTGCGPAVYCYISVDHSPGSLTGSEIEAPETRGACGKRFPYVTSSVSGGRNWHVFRMDTCFTPDGTMVADKYCIDLNDNLFVPGDTCWFFFGAKNATGAWNYYSLPHEQSNSINLVAGEPDEFSILPGYGDPHWGPYKVLYVDGVNLRGSQPYFDWAFSYSFATDEIDRYDVRGADSGVGNRPGSRVANAGQLISAYKTIIWHTGDLTLGCIGNGWGYEKSDDATLLYNFLDQHTADACGIYFSGDNLAYELSALTGSGAAGLRTYINYTVVNDDHVQAGAGISPAVKTAPTSLAFHETDSMIAYGGCPVINDFDVLASVPGLSQVEMNYHNFVTDAVAGGAIVSQQTVNTQGNTARVLLSGFGYDKIRDIHHVGWLDRWHHLWDILLWLRVNIPADVISAPPTPARNSLAQNYPNPFNPVTTIKYTLKQRAHVSLKVYNVAGQLVRTLVDEVQNPTSVKPVEWRGLNNNGQEVASGVYFYKLVTKDFSKTRKMVLLK